MKTIDKTGLCLNLWCLAPLNRTTSHPTWGKMVRDQCFFQHEVFFLKQ